LTSAIANLASSWASFSSSRFLSFDFYLLRIGGVEGQVGDFGLGFGGGPDGFMFLILLSLSEFPDADLGGFLAF